MANSGSHLLHPRSWPIAVKISRDLLIAAIVPLVVAFWLGSTRAREALDSSARENVELLASVTATRLDQLIVDTSRTVAQAAGEQAVIELCANGKAVAPAAFEAVQRKLALVAATNPDASHMFIADAAGKGIAGTRDENIGMDYNFREYFQAARKGTPFVSEMLVGKTSSQPGIYLSAPVRAAASPDGGGGGREGGATGAAQTQGEVIGVAVLKLKGERVWEIIDSVHPGRHGYTMLSEKHGVVIAHPKKDKLYHSFAQLSEQQMKAIDPEKSWSIKAIRSLDIPELMAPLSAPRARGSANFASVEGDSPTAAPWVAGFAPMSQREWVVTVAQPQSQFMAPIRALQRQQWVIVSVVALLAAAAALWRARTIVRPAQELTSAAQKLAAGDLEARAPVSSGDEIGKLATVFNDMVPKLKEHMDLRQSLATAMDVQKSLLPEGDPTRPGLDIAGRSRYCDATGGDYYDFLDVAPVEGGATLIAVGDVMGHGVAAALIMAAARAAVRSGITEAVSLGEVMTRVNRVLAADARHNRFVTMALLVLNPKEGSARWASAGHDPSIVYDPTTDSFFELEGGDVPLGIIPDTMYAEHRSGGLNRGMIVVVGTDGVWETANPARELFGKDRLREVIRGAYRGGAAAIAAALEKALAEFRGEAAVLDDITFVVARLT